MKYVMVGIAFVLIAAIPGCGGSTPPALPEKVQPSHNGAIVPLAESKGYVELIVTPDNPKSKAKNAKGRLVAYFLNKEGAPTDPAPTDIAYTDEAGATQKLTTKTDESAKAAFQSEPATFPLGRELTGELSATFDGSAVKTPISVR